MKKFTSRFTTVVAGLMLYGFASHAMATSCTSTTSWGSLGPPDVQSFGHSFTAAGNYTDCFTFTLSANADSFGGVLEIDSWLNKLDIDLTGVSLFNGGIVGGTTVGSLLSFDSAPSQFAFNALSMGTYSLVVGTSVTRDFGLFDTDVSYFGTITTVAGPKGAVSVPEPGLLALFALGLIGFALRRRHSA
jgi:hypothetical protein